MIRAAHAQNKFVSGKATSCTAPTSVTTRQCAQCALHTELPYSTWYFSALPTLQYLFNTWTQQDQQVYLTTQLV